MSAAITKAVYDVLAGDAQLAALLNTYLGAPAIFTIDPAPGDAVLPYIITAGAVAVTPFDTKTTLGRTVFRDVRCYTAASGSSVLVERLAERVRELFHRQALTIDGFVWIMSEVTGVINADEQDAYARLVNLSLTMEEI
jgi:hypothetical protein